MSGALGLSNIEKPATLEVKGMRSDHCATEAPNTFKQHE